MPSEGRVLGVDPGSQHLGWGVLAAAGTRPRHLASGTLHAPAGATLPARLLFLADGLAALIERWRPTTAAVESVFHGVNAKSALILGQARGAVLLTLARAALPVATYAPAAIKQAATGNGAADKAQVAAMMRLLFGLAGPREADTTDALAAAWCHLQALGSSFAAPPAHRRRRTP